MIFKHFELAQKKDSIIVRLPLLNIILLYVNGGSKKDYAYN